MIVKKLHRSVRPRFYEKKTNNFLYDEVRDYIGYYLFGFIPIYVKMINRMDIWQNDNGTENKLTFGVYEDFKELIK